MMPSKNFPNPKHPYPYNLKASKSKSSNLDTTSPTKNKDKNPTKKPKKSNTQPNNKLTVNKLTTSSAIIKILKTKALSSSPIISSFLSSTLKRNNTSSIMRLVQYLITIKGLKSGTETSMCRKSTIFKSFKISCLLYPSCQILQL